MRTVERLQQWKDAGAITTAQFGTIAAIVRKDRFSIFVELNALLYLGVLAFVAGLGWTIQTYFANIGDAAILIGLSTLLAASLYYCFSRAPEWSTARVESPNMAFDYVLYLACLVFAAELGYIETRFQLLGAHRDYYLLFSAVLYFIAAYRFDNRFVLSLALSTLAAWFGVKMSAFAFISNESLRLAAISYGAVVGGLGAWLSRQGIKRHFLETYLHIAANVLFIAFVSGVFEGDRHWIYFAGLMALVVISINAGVRFRRFAFVVYGTVYGYVGVSAEILRDTHDSTADLLYVVVSGTIVIISIVLLARRFGREQ
jgi:hypothetical protein